MTLSQTLSGGGKDTEKARPRGQFRDGERVGEAGGRRVRAGGWEKGQQGAGQAMAARASALSYVWGTKKSFTRDRSLLFSGPTALADRSPLKQTEKKKKLRYS